MILILDQPAGEIQQKWVAQEIDHQIEAIKSNHKRIIQDFSRILNILTNNMHKEPISNTKVRLLFYTFKCNIIKFIEEKRNKLVDNSNRGFSETDLNLMTKILQFSGEDIKRGDKIDDQKFSVDV